MSIVQNGLSRYHEPGPQPFRPGVGKQLSVGAEELLRAHRKHQRELMMANRTAYRDLGLVFAKEWSDLQRAGEMLGYPLQMNNLGQREYATLIKAAKVRRSSYTDSGTRARRCCCRRARPSTSSVNGSGTPRSA